MGSHCRFTNRVIRLVCTILSRIPVLERITVHIWFASLLREELSLTQMFNDTHLTRMAVVSSQSMFSARSHIVIYFLNTFDSLIRSN